MIDVSRKKARGAGWRVLLALGVAVAVPAGAAAAPPEVPATRPQDRAIFDEAAARRWSDMVDAHATEEPWTPTLGDVVVLEGKLPGYLRRHTGNRGNEPLWKREPGYKRQYIGLTRRGRRLIYANFFCQVPSTRAADWRSVAVIVDDGGDCYFTVLYDVKRGTFHHLLVNGEA